MSLSLERPRKSAADRLEGLAFQFCKIATVALLAGRYTLLVAAVLSTVLFVAAYAKGKRESRCFVRYPLLIAALWALGAIWAAMILWNPDAVERLKSSLWG